MPVSTRILFDKSSLGGQMLALATNYTILAQQQIARAKALADAVAAGGVTPTNLNASAEFGASVVDGASLYTAINNLKTNLATVTAASLENLDQG